MKKKSLQNRFGVKIYEHVIATGAHEHANHPDFKFVVEAISFDENDKSIKKGYDMEEGANVEWHALIYADEYIAITLYECCYAMWYLRENKNAGVSLWKNDSRWHFTAKSLKNIKKYLKEING